MQKILLVLVFVSAGIMSFAGNGNKALKVKPAVLELAREYGDLENGIEFFHGSWAEAKKKADKGNKLIFLDAMTSWCGPCKMMARNTFTDAEVGKFFNKNFVNYKMDMEKNEDGPRLSRKFKLTAYPSLYFLDENENIVHSSLGYQKPAQLLALAKTALSK